MSIKLIYGDIPLGAAENAAVSTSESETFSDISAVPFGSDTGAVATLEKNAWGLSADFKVRKSQPFSFWSENVSDADGVFDAPPVLTLDFSEQYAATGLTFRFSPAAGEYCREIFVEWWQNGALRDSGTYYPTTPNFTLNNTVEAFDSISVSFNKTSLPFRRVKLEFLGVGVIREITGRELTGCTIDSEVDLISDTLPINQMDAEFISETDIEFIFQNKQPVEVYDGQNLLGVYYIKEGERDSRTAYKIKTQDKIGLLDDSDFPGAIWFEDKPLREVLELVIGTEYKLDISPELEGITLKGLLEKGTRRAVVQQIAFAAGVVIDTFGTDKIRVFAPEVTGSGTEISDKETFTGGKVTVSDIITSVEVTGFDIYDERPVKGDEFDTIYDDYITWNNVEYKCDIVTGVAKNPDVAEHVPEKVLKYEKCYLVSTATAQARADAVLAYYMRRNTYDTTHVLRGEKPGDRVNVATPWYDRKNANILSMKITASGLIVSDAVFLID